MIRLLVRAVVFLASAAVGLLVAAQLLDDFHVGTAGFVTTVVVYSVIQMLISPFLAMTAAQHASAFLGGTGLIATFVALLVASMVGDSLTVSGVATWIAATVIVWLVTALGTLLLPFLLVKAGVEAARSRRSTN